MNLNKALLATLAEVPCGIPQAELKDCALWVAERNATEVWIYVEGEDRRIRSVLAPLSVLQAQLKK